jgi:AcrR family transcriptional regulator
MKMARKAGNFHHGNLSAALVGAATKLILERKATNFSLREVALSLGVSHAAAYRHFKSKSDLLALIAQAGFVDLRTALEGAFVKTAGNIDAPQSLKAMGRAYVDFATNNPGSYRTLFHPDICDPAQYPALSVVSYAALQVLVEMLELGQARGEINSTQSGQVLATSVWAALHGYSLLLLDMQITEDGAYPAPPSNRELFLDFIYSQLFVKS